MSTNKYRVHNGQMFTLRRLKFLASPKARSSKNLLKSYKNKYWGEKAIIICNGPSLKKVNLKKLSNVFTFGLNKINLIFDQSDFRPSCIVAVNKLVLEQNERFFEQTSIPTFVDGINARGLQHHPATQIHLCCYERGFSFNPEKYVSQGGTVTFVALQLAYYFGFHEVSLVGCDHYYKFSGKPHELLSGGNIDENHFSENYFSNQNWNAPDLAMSENSYKMALDAFLSNGRALYNSSVNSSLEILPKISISKFLKQ